MAFEAARGITYTGTKTKIKNKMDALKAEYHAKIKPSFDVLVEVPRVYEAIFAETFETRPNPFKHGVHRVMLWWGCDFFSHSFSYPPKP